MPDVTLDTAPIWFNLPVIDAAVAGWVCGALLVVAVITAWVVRRGDAGAWAGAVSGMFIIPGEFMVYDVFRPVMGWERLTITGLTTSQFCAWVLLGFVPLGVLGSLLGYLFDRVQQRRAATQAA